MGTRSRIRWPKVAKLALAALSCLALFAGLPSLIRRPEPVPLEPDIGLAPLAASGVPARSGLRPESVRERHAAQGADRHAAQGTDRRRRRVHDRRRRGPRPARREAEPPSIASPVAAISAPAPAPATAAVPTAAAPLPPAPPPPQPTAAPPARAPASPATASEFGFER